MGIIRAALTLGNKYYRLRELNFLQPGFPRVGTLNPFFRPFIRYIQYQAFFGKPFTGTRSPQIRPGINGFLLPQIIFLGRWQLICNKNLGLRFRTVLGGFSAGIRAHGLFHNTLWTSEIRRGIVGQIRYRRLHELTPNRGGTRDTRCIHHGGIVCIAHPDARYQIRSITDRPVIPVLIGRSCLGGCREGQIEDGIRAKHGRPCGSI